MCLCLHDLRNKCKRFYVAEQIIHTFNDLESIRYIRQPLAMTPFCRIIFVYLFSCLLKIKAILFAPISSAKTLVWFTLRQIHSNERTRSTMWISFAGKKEWLHAYGDSVQFFSIFFSMADWNIVKSELNKQTHRDANQIVLFTKWMDLIFIFVRRSTIFSTHTYARFRTHSGTESCKNDS